MKFFQKLFKVKWLVVSITLALCVVCGFLISKVSINSDISTYLPDDSISKQSIEFLKENFDIKGDALLAITAELKDMKSVEDALSKIGKVTDINGDKTLWLGSFSMLFTDPITGTNIITMPEYWNESQKEIAGKYFTYDKSNKGTYIINLSLAVSNPSTEASKAMDEVISIMGDSGLAYYLGGTAMESKTMLDSALGELPKFMIVALIFILIILVITTKSIFSAFAYLLTIGVSIVINMGSNMMLDSISTVTFSAAAILQLALAMDYSIFLNHAYDNAKKKYKTPSEAMGHAVLDTLKTISASSATTIAGFVALFAMQFTIGFDLGIVLAKGVFLSLVAVILFQPCLLLMLDKVIDKTTHPKLNLRLKFLEKLPSKLKYVGLILAVIIIFPAFIGQSKVEYYYLNTFYDDSAVGAKQVVQDLGSQAVIAVKEGTAQQHKKFIDNVSKLKTNGEVSVNDITGFYTYVYSLLPEGVTLEMLAQSPLLEHQMLLGYANALKGQFFNDGYTFYTLILNGSAEDSSTSATLESINKEAIDIFGGTVYSTGNAQVVKDLGEITQKDFLVVSLISAALILLILLLTLRRVFQSVLLVFIIELGILVNLALVYFLGARINFMSYIIISAIQMGATIDYAILLTDKFNNFRKTMHSTDAMKEALKVSCPSILVSALILMASCLSVYFISSDVIVGEITMLIARGSAISACLVLLILPCLLILIKKKDTIAPKLEQENVKKVI